VVTLTAGLAQAELLGSTTGANSCSAPPYRARWVQYFRGCPQTNPCCNEYGLCVSQEAWQNGQYRDCNGISNGFSLPDSTINDEQNAANSGDFSGLRMLAVPRNRQFFSGIIGGITSGFGGILNGVGNAVGGIIGGVGGAVGGIASGVGSTIGGVANGAGNGIGGIASGVGNGIGGIASGVGGTVGGVASGTGNAIGGIASGAGNTLGGVVQGTGNIVGGVANGVGNTVSNVANGGRPNRPNRPNRRPGSNRPIYFNRPYTTTVYKPSTFTTSSFQTPVNSAPVVTYTPVDPVQSNVVSQSNYITQSVLKPNKKICKRSDGYYYC